MKFGRALKILRSIKSLNQIEVASGVYMDERTYREIEADRRALSAKEVALFADFFKVDIQLIYDIAQNTVPIHNMVHEAKRDGIVINQGKETQDNSDLIAYLLKRVRELEKIIEDLQK